MIFGYWGERNRVGNLLDFFGAFLTGREDIWIAGAWRGKLLFEIM